MPIACVTLTLSGYRNPPHGRLRGEAVPCLSRRTPEGEGAAHGTRRARAAVDDSVRTAPAETVDVEAMDARRRSRAHRVLRALGVRRLPVTKQRGVRRELATPCGDDFRAHEPERPHPRRGDEHPPARY